MERHDQLDLIFGTARFTGPHEVTVDTPDVDIRADGRDLDGAFLRNPHRNMARGRAPTTALSLDRFYLDHNGVAFSLEDEFLHLLTERSRDLDRAPRPAFDRNGPGGVIDLDVAVRVRVERLVNLFGVDRGCKQQPYTH